MKPVALSLLLAGLTASVPCFALDGYFVDAGGNNRIQAAKIGMIRQWHSQWLHRDQWHVTGYWETTLAYLHSDGPAGRDLADISLTPVFRLHPDTSGGIQPYLDAAIGAHLLSGTRLDDSHKLGSAFQFGPLLGLGVTFGEKSQYDLGYRYQHMTNGGIATPNDGFDLHEIRLTYLY